MTETGPEHTPHRLQRAWTLWRREGTFRLLQRLCAMEGFPRWLFFVGCVQVLKLAQFNERAVRRPLSRYELRPATPADIDALVACTADTDAPLLRRKFREFFAEGQLCTAAWDGDRVAGYNWGFRKRYVITFDGYRRRNLELRLDDSEAFLGNGYIAGPYRLKGIFPHLAAARLRRFPGQNAFYTFVADTNEGSLRANRRLGMAPYAVVVCLTFLGWTVFLGRPAGRRRWTRIATATPVPVRCLGADPGHG